MIRRIIKNLVPSTAFIGIALHGLGCRNNLQSQNLGESEVLAEASWIANGVKVKGPGLLAPAEALVWATKIPSHRSTLILSPGAAIPPEAIRGLASSLAATGRIVFVMSYFNNLPIIPGQSGKIGKLIELLKRNPDSLNGLNPLLVNEYRGNNELPVSLFGYSAGGAILGGYIADSESPAKHVALYGVSTFVNPPAAISTKVGLFIGSKDGLLLGDEEAKQKVIKAETLLAKKRTTLDGLNHFCIVSDPNVGAPDYRARDLATKLTSDQCIASLTQAVDSFLP